MSPRVAAYNTQPLGATAMGSLIVRLSIAALHGGKQYDRHAGAQGHHPGDLTGGGRP
jgi:hypothetical protein